MQRMVMNHYRGVFTNRWGETWYSSTIRPIIEAAIENETKYKKEANDKSLYTQRLHGKDWEPYELIIETQIGLVLVMCQTYITTVISQIGNFYKDYEETFDKKLFKINTSKRALIANYGPRIKNSEYRSVQGIDALANYFKHHEEWGSDLISLSENEKRTAEIVSVMGARLGLALWYSRNLTKCIKKLGVDRMEDLFLLPQIVDDWKFDIGKSFPELSLT